MFPVTPPAVIVLSNLAVPSNSAVDANVVTPAMLTLSKFVWPSTSKIPETVVFPVTSRPASQSKCAFISTWPSGLTLSLFVLEVVSLIAKYPLSFLIS